MDEDTQEPVHVAVDATKCIGAGQCEMLEEETFLVDDETVVSGVIGSGQLPVGRARRVVETCPVGAIFINSNDEK